MRAKTRNTGKKVVLALFFVLLVSTVWALGVHEYWWVTGDTVTFGWDAVAGAEGYEVKLNHIERNNETDLGRTNNTQMDIVLARTGHTDFMVRAYRVDPVGEVFSDWATANDAAYGNVDGTAHGWRAFVRPAPPGPIIIGYFYLPEDE